MTGVVTYTESYIPSKVDREFFKRCVLSVYRLLNVLEVIAPFKHFNKLREFVQMKLPPGFPVKLGKRTAQLRTKTKNKCSAFVHGEREKFWHPSLQRPKIKDDVSSDHDAEVFVQCRKSRKSSVFYVEIALKTIQISCS